MPEIEHARTSAGYSQRLSVPFLLVLMGLWMTLFTLGSQVPSSTFADPMLRYVTAATPNIIILGCVSSMIGVLKRHLRQPDQ